MKRMLVILLVLAFVFSMSATALAVEDIKEEAGSDIGLMYTYINYATCSININSSGRADMAATFDCYSSVQKTRISARLQQYDGGWKTVNSWVKEANSDYVAWSQSYYVAKGYQYRLYCFYYAYIGGTVVEGTTLTHYDTY